MGKNTPISAFKPGLNLETKLMKIEHESWKMIIKVEALFFRRERHKYCLMAPKNLIQYNKKVSINHAMRKRFKYQTLEMKKRANV